MSFVVAHLIDGSLQRVDVYKVDKIEIHSNVVVLTMKNSEQLRVINFEPKRDFDLFDKPMTGLEYLINTFHSIYSYGFSSRKEVHEPGNCEQCHEMLARIDEQRGYSLCSDCRMQKAIEEAD